MEINFWSPLGPIPTKIKLHILIYVGVTEHATLLDCTNASRQENILSLTKLMLSLEDNLRGWRMDGGQVLVCWD